MNPKGVKNELQLKNTNCDQNVAQKSYKKLFLQWENAPLRGGLSTGYSS